jgi:RNA methyltransferase, TrmH family
MKRLSQRRARLVQRLRTRKTRQREARVLVEGVRSVAEALDAGAAVDFAVMSPRLVSTEAGRALRRRLEVGHEVLMASDVELEELADTGHPQGVLLVCAEPSTDLDSLSGQGGVLVLDAVQDPGNVGTLVRSAVAFGLAGVVALDGTVDPWSAKAVRASAGTAFRLPIVVAAAPDALGWMRAGELAILVAAEDGVPVLAWRRAGSRLGPFALVVGNEGAGVRSAFREAADAVIAVEMSGPAESLNVGVAGSILMHELTKRSE